MYSLEFVDKRKGREEHAAHLSTCHSTHPGVPLLNGLGEGLGEQDRATYRSDDLVPANGMANQSIDPLIEGALGRDGRKLAHHAFELKLCGLLEQRLHVVEVPEDSTGRNSGSLGHFLCRRAQQTILEAIEHGLGHRRPSAKRARLPSVRCFSPGFVYRHHE